MNTIGHTAKDWPEDFSHENGNYQCLCSSCGGTFIGHKRRMTCKECATMRGVDGDIAALKGDAARYRWLREQREVTWGETLDLYTEEDLDAAIDAAMRGVIETIHSTKEK